jgi:hypothetical protein
MPWDKRGDKRYFYTAERVNGRPVRRYVGTGPAAELAAAADDLLRVERAAAAREHRDEQARHEEADAPLRELCQLSDLLARAALLGAGFQQHARGVWRRRRGRETES